MKFLFSVCRPSIGSKAIGLLRLALLALAPVFLAATALADTAPVITSALAANLPYNATFTYQITASNSATSFAATNLPSGFTVNSSGVIAGFNDFTNWGSTFTVTISATNAAGTGSASLVLTVKGPAPIIASTLSINGTTNQAFSYQIPANAAESVFHGAYSATGLPAGLSLNSSTGLISGTLTAGTGAYPVALSISNDFGTSTSTLTINVNSPVISSALTANAAQGQSFSYQITASNSPTSYGATGLPAGLSVNSSTGLISGSATATPGLYSVTISATNASTGSATLALTVTGSNAPAITSSLSVRSTDGDFFSYQITATNSPTSYGLTGMPSGFNFNASTGLISGQNNISGWGTYNVTLSATNASGTGVATLAIFFAGPAPALTSSATVAASVGSAFSYQLAANTMQGVFHPVWNVSGLPAGLSFSSTTLKITGTPTGSPGTYPISVAMTNDYGSTNATVTLTLAAAPTANPNITSSLTASATVGVAFSYQITADNSPTSYTATGLPSALSLNQQSGLISGTPVGTTGPYLVSISATNAVGTTHATLTLTLHSPTITSPLAVSATAGSAFSYQITTSEPEDGYAVSGLPAGLSSDYAAGLIHGTPTAAAGTYSVTLYATNGYGSISATLVITLVAAGTNSAPSITSSLAASATTGQSFSYQIGASNGATSYNATGLPAGLSVNPTTGAITGILAGPAGTYSIGLSATNGTGSSNVTLVLTVTAAVTGASPTITSGLLAVAWVGQSFNYQLTATNGATSYSAAGLPAGLSINATTGAISGTPTDSPRLYPVTLGATNPFGSTSATLSLGLSSSAQSVYTPYTFSTYSGQAVVGSADGAATIAQFNAPSGVAMDSSGNVYVADAGNNLIRKVASGGAVTTFAGSQGVAGSADGTGTAAQFSGPCGVAVDGSGNVYVADTGNQTIRLITSSGVVTTLAGSPGSVGSANGTGGAARFSSPTGLAVDSSGVLYVADSGNDEIRKIAAGGVVTTLAGSAGSFGSADGTGASAQFFSPSGVAVDGSGNVYVADDFNDTIRKVTPAGVVSTLAGSAGNPGCADGAGTAAQFDGPIDLSVDGSGNVYVADAGSDTIRMITAAGVVTTLGGSAGVSGIVNGTGSAARFASPCTVAATKSGAVYLADGQNSQIRLGVSGATGPVITGQPQSVTAAVGASFSLSVTATGTGTLAYQWYLNGAALPGQTGASFSDSSAQTTDAGSYTVKVSDSSGTSTTSSAATVNVTASSSSGGSTGSGGGSGSGSSGGTSSGGGSSTASSPGGGGGGAPSLWFFAALAAVLGVRRWRTATAAGQSRR